MPELIPDALRDAARLYGQHTALRYRGRSLTWAELDADATRAMTQLRRLGVERGDRVGVLLQKRPEAVAVLYGLLGSGGVYVPLDALAPDGWTRDVIAGCGVSVLVTTPDRAASLRASGSIPSVRGLLLVSNDDETDSPTSVGGVPALRFVNGGAAAGDATSDSLSIPGASVPDDIALIAYTSGSSGRPKGVAVSHRALLLHCDWLRRQFAVDTSSRLSVYPPLHFKMSLYGLLTAALAGAASVLIPLETGFRGHDLARLIRREAITHWKSVPNPLKEIAEAGEPPASFPSLRVVHAGGGTLRAGDVRALRSLAPQADLWQGYGSTESSTMFLHQIRDEPIDGEVIPVGSPVADVRIVLRGEDGRQVAQTEVGELFVSSPRLMTGYWNDPTQTSDVLVADPLGNGDPATWYRTGDRLRQRPDGLYEFVGRADRMIKTRGYRVELGMVERAAEVHPRVAEAAVVAIPHASWGKVIVGFAVPCAGERLTERDILRHLRERLPAYMLPQRTMIMNRLPRTSNGKVDRVALSRLAEGQPTDR